LVFIDAPSGWVTLLTLALAPFKVQARIRRQGGPFTELGIDEPLPACARGAGFLGEVAQFESISRLCYLRGPAGIIVALAEQIG